jgi:Protocatechuate 3,4-dioxygenase beta subunit
MCRKTLFPLLLVLLVVGICSCSHPAPVTDYVCGVVKDMEGNPIIGVEVESNYYSVQTDAHGMFTLDRVQNTGGRYVVNFRKRGYFSVVRSGEVGSVGLMDVVMVKENVENVSTTATFTASQGTKVSVGRMTVDFPQNAIVYEDGTPCEGEVNVSVLYLDPTKPSFQSAMPGGDLVAQRSNSEEVPLVSYGMVNVVMQDSVGKKLQVNEMVKSKVTFPIPAGMSKNAPDQMPLWHFNENTGLWEESGMAVRNGDVYEGEVAHFSWVNLDDPKEFVVLEGTVRDENGNPLSGIKVVVEQVYTYSDGNGRYRVRIPSETDVTVKVRKEDYLNYDNEFSVLVEGQPGGTTYTQDIVLPAFPLVVGELENMCGANVVVPVYCRYERNGQTETTRYILPDENGVFSVKVPSDARNVVLRVVVPGGEEVSKDVAFTGEDYQIYDPVMFCLQDVEERDRPRLVVGEDVIMFDDNELDCSLFRGKHLGLEGSGIAATLYNYNEKSFRHDGYVEIDKYHFESTSARIEKRKVGNSVEVRIVATGTAELEEGVKSNASFEGTYKASYMYAGPCDDFSKLCWNPMVPTMRTPIPFVAQENMLAMPRTCFYYDKFMAEDIDKIERLVGCSDPFNMHVGYSEADESTYNDVVAALEARGFSAEKGDKGDIFYIKDDLGVIIRYGEDCKMGPSEQGAPTVKLVIDVAPTQGFVKWFVYLIKRFFGIDLSRLFGL